MNRFSDFADPAGDIVLDGKKVPLADVVGREIAVLGYRIGDTKYRDSKNPRCLTVHFSFVRPDFRNGEYVEEDRHVFFSGSTVLMGQLEKYKDRLPFRAVVKRVGKYFTLS